MDDVSYDYLLADCLEGLWTPSAFLKAFLRIFVKLRYIFDSIVKVVSWSYDPCIVVLH